MWTECNSLTALKISHPSLVLCTGLIYPQRTCCVGLACQPVLYPAAVSGSGFQGDSCLLSIFLGFGDFFCLLFLHTHSWYLVFCVGGKLPSPLEKYICTDHCQTEVHTSGHLWAILLCQEEQMLSFATKEVWWQNA